MPDSGPTRTVLICLLALLTLCKILPGTCQLESVDFKVIREVSISQYDYAIYNDTYLLNETAIDWLRTSGSKWYIGFPSEWENKLGDVPIYPAAYISKDQRLNVSKQIEGDIVWFLIDVSPILSDNLNHLTLNFSIILTGITKSEYSSSEANVLLVHQSAYKVQGGPSLTKVTILGNGSFQYLPPLFMYLDQENKTITAGSATTYFEPEQIEARVKLTEQRDIIARNLYKKFTFDPLFGITVEDGYGLFFENYVYGSISIEVPFDAYNIKATDLTGDLSCTVNKNANLSITLVSVNPRYFMYPGINYTFFVSYSLPSTSYVKTSGDLFILSSPMFENFSEYTNTMRLKVSLPIGAKLNQLIFSNISITQLKKEGDISYFEINNCTNTFLNGMTSLKFSYSYLWAGYSIGMVFTIFGLCLIAAMVPIKFRKKVFPEAPSIPQNKMLTKEFASEYSKMLELQGSIQELEDEFILGNVSRKDYRLRRVPLMEKLDEVSKRIQQLRNRLDEQGPKVSDVMREIERLETELYGKQASLREIGSRFMNRRISKKSYNELASKYSKEIEDLTNRMLELIQTL